MPVEKESQEAAHSGKYVRVRPWELLLYAVLVAGLAYYAGHRAGYERANHPPPAQAQEGAPHGAMGPEAPSGSPGGGMSMSPEQLKANLSKVTDVNELIGIANQHLDNARSLEGSGQRSGTKMLYTIAVAAYERALELKPKDPNLLTDLGIAYRGLGDSQSAVARFREAAQADPKHPQSRFNLGLVLRDDLHDNAGARAAWEDYLRVAPKDDPAHKDVESQLKKLE